MCEGELKSFGAKFIKTKGKKVAVFKKGGCLGTSSLIGLNTSDEESAQGLQWPASLPQVCPFNTCAITPSCSAGLHAELVVAYGWLLKMRQII